MATERARYVFKATRYPDGTPWIWLEPANNRGGLGALKGAVLGLDLAEGTTFQQAQELARLLREKVTEVTITRPAGGPEEGNGR